MWTGTSSPEGKGFLLHWEGLCSRIFWRMDGVTFVGGAQALGSQSHLPLPSRTLGAEVAELAASNLALSLHLLTQAPEHCSPGLLSGCRAQALGSSSTAFPESLQEVTFKLERSDLKQAPVWDASSAGGGFTYCTTVPPCCVGFL